MMAVCTLLLILHLKTSIPADCCNLCCIDNIYLFSGNPKRVQTGEVMCMPGVATSAIQREDVETQGEQQLRAMAQKQLKTDLSLQE